MLANAGESYRLAEPIARRHINQAIFSAVYLDSDEVRYAALAGAFNYVVDNAPPEPPTEAGMKEPRPRCRGRGLSKTHLVELMRQLSNQTPVRCQSQG